MDQRTQSSKASHSLTNPTNHVHRCLFINWLWFVHRWFSPNASTLLMSTRIAYILQNIDDKQAVTLRAGSRQEAYDFIKANTSNPNRWSVIDSFILPPERY